AAVLAEHGCQARGLGVALDGTGWGDDGTAWGGEFLAADLAGYERLAHFAPVPLPGGDRAAEEPWRLALWVLYRRDGAGFAARFPQFAAQLPTGWELLMQATAAGLSAPLTSSAGRLFDAAAALLGVAYRSAYEGQAPIELERLARTARRAGCVLPYTVAEGAQLTVDVLPALYALADGAEELTAEERAGRALDFHVTMAAAVAEVLGILSVRTGLRTVALAGGVFQNALLLEELLPRIGDHHVLLPHRIPPNDGGIAYGQAAVALARMRCS
ncbi:MAG: carbamoyltransferase HypF, partial [Selenomonas sp.]|nr:carbamoyltransferase HypF [Selenomonas sp.]